ncbi:M48 family metalloprotease [Streptomyces alboflavus]|uniref:M48 family metalloprotease n=1 Tax=Streptomyces alboflavus TaxID=67267 RepID=UPI001F00D771|nr:M48 family metalloprotease [Streptomyces alboflavus]
MSFLLVASLSLGIMGNVGWLVILGWLASGALVFHRPTELAFARHVLGLRTPLVEERSRLEPVWREVTARAGIEARTYELMVENSNDLNAMAAAGHVVGVTTYSLNSLPSSKLGAVLAHELGHHIGGHSWAGLLGHWYSLPGRLVWNLARRVTRGVLSHTRRVSLLATGMILFCLGGYALVIVASLWFVVIPLMAAPYVLAFLGRRAELRADQQAAALGFAPMLTEVLHDMEAQEAAERAHAVATGRKVPRPGRLALLLSNHPDHYARLRALEPHLTVPR